MEDGTQFRDNARDASIETDLPLRSMGRFQKAAKTILVPNLKERTNSSAAQVIESSDQEEERIFESRTPWSSRSNTRHIDGSSLTLGCVNGDDEADTSKSASDFSIYADTDYQDSENEQPNAMSSLDDFTVDQLWPSVDDISENADLGAKHALSNFGSIKSEEAPRMPTEIHILGVGNMGKFMAHGLAGLPNPPNITLLMQRPLLMQRWHDEGASISVLKNGRVDTRTGFNIESSANIPRFSPLQRFAGFGRNLEHTVEPSDTAIDALIVTTSSKVTIPALMAVRHRLRPTSSIHLMQDGMGIVEDLNAVVFPDPHRRPSYILGHMRNAQVLRATERTFMIEQKGTVTVTCSMQPQIYALPATTDGPVIKRRELTWPVSASFLVGSVCRVPELNTLTLNPQKFLRSQLHRLVTHAIIGPVSVMHDCNNGELHGSYYARMTMQALVKELSRVILALPELQGLSRIEEDFSTLNLWNIVRKTLLKSPSAVSDMLQKVRLGKRTDIDYYNGYFQIRAVELGISCPRNEMVINIVKGKQIIQSRNVDTYIPFTGE